MEKFDLLDKNRNFTGVSAIREDNQILAEETYRQVVHIAIFNNSGEMLIQQRQSSKNFCPDLWDVSVGGSVLSGETPCEAATRELFEELGVSYDFSKNRPAFTMNFSSGFDDYFILNIDINLSDFKLQIEEVQNVEWASLEKILELIKQGKFINYYENLIRLLFEKKDKPLGAIKK